MPVPIVYGKGNESAGFNFDFFDASNGLGYEAFYGTTTSAASGAIYYRLMNTAISPYSQFSYDGQDDPIDFTTTFNNSKTLKGKAIIYVHWGFRGNGNVCNMFMELQALKNSELIGIASGAILASTTNTDRREVFELELDTTRLSPSDTFTLRTTIKSSQVSPPLIMTWTGHDPTNASGTPASSWTGGAVSNTELKAYIPFKIDN